MIWYAIRVSPQKERAVRRAFRRQGQTVYLPATIPRRSRKPRALGKRSVVPLLPGYLFLKAPSSPLIPLWMHQVKDTRNVLSFVTVNGEPGPIADAKIQRLKDAIAEHISDQTLRRMNAKLRKGGEARFKSGPFSGKTGTVSWMRGNRVKILAWLLGSPREIELKVDQVEVA